MDFEASGGYRRGMWKTLGMPGGGRRRIGRELKMPGGDRRRVPTRFQSSGEPLRGYSSTILSI